LDGEPITAPLAGEFSRKSRWAAWLAACSALFLFCPCLLPILRTTFMHVSGMHVHPHATIFGFVVSACIATSLALDVASIVLGVLAVREIRGSAGRLSGLGWARFAVATGVVLAVGTTALIPLVAAAREAARRTQCRCFMKQLGLAFRNYNDYHKCFPPYAICDRDGKPLLSWRVALLPFLAQLDLYAQFRLDEPWDSAHNLPLVARMPDVFRCPSDSQSAADSASYVVVTGPGTFFPHDRQLRVEEVTDGTSYTIIVGERVGGTSPWTKPDDIAWDEILVGRRVFSSSHPGGSCFLMGDGACRFVRSATDPAVIRGLLTIAGGEPIDHDDY
jgi:hypothetical protein